MKSLTTLLAIMGFIMLCTTSCYYDVEEELYPSGSTTCDTSNVTFSSQVSLVLQTNCLACHSSTNSGSIGGGIDLEGYTQVKVYVDNGKLLSSITHDGNASFMPKSTNNTMLPACDINQITAWINAGALNN